MKTIFQLVSLILFPLLVGMLMPQPGEDSAVSAGTVILNPDHLDGAFTGGFGEETCRSCHFDYELNMEGGSLTTDGIPNVYQAGKIYPVEVAVQSEHLEIGGFQMTARFEDGSQAGEFRWEGDRLALTPSVSGEVQYLQHSESGTQPDDNRRISWTFEWVAPPNSTGNIIFNIAANAGNYDDSSFGDRIYAKEMTARPPE